MGRYGFVGVELVTAIAAGFYGGHWLDARFHTGGVLTWVGLLLGVYAGFHTLVVTAKRLQRESERVEHEEEEERRAEEARAALRAHEAREEEEARLRAATERRAAKRGGEAPPKGGAT